MLQFDKNGNVTLYPHKVRFYWHDEEIQENWALPTKEWWTETAEKHPDLHIVEFVEFELTPEQLQRYEDIKSKIVDGYPFTHYILEGELPRYEYEDENGEKVVQQQTIEELIAHVEENFGK